MAPARYAPALVAALLSSADAAAAPAGDRAAFARFQRQHGRSYSSAAEEDSRFAAFRANLALIEEGNAHGRHGVLGVGPFADLTESEFLQRYTAPSPPPPASWADAASYLGEHRAAPGEALAPSIDWVEKGAVTSVKNQRCGNCWTFSAAGSLEGAHQIATGTLTNYSVRHSRPLRRAPPHRMTTHTFNSYPWLNSPEGVDDNLFRRSSIPARQQPRGTRRSLT